MNADRIGGHLTGFAERTAVGDQAGQQRDSYLITAPGGGF